ncbi:aminodeoxychorismate lyase [Aquisalimonas sp.]|uniref:aminodeoxychorismate lyase n=1 Tax=Aquisalimonas sp. TaxID=1872621 RepID=UPI0025BA6D8D|nr:aminodeoxychorismate lyase [Aquisalimonas sp.]
MNRIGYLIDGAASAQLPADDRGLQFGDGLFETVAVVDGYPRLLEAHLQRLTRDAVALGLPEPDPDLIASEAVSLAAWAGDCGVLKILWTGGSGGRGYARPQKPSPRRILSLHPAPAHPRRYWEQGVRATVTTVRLARQPLLAGIKHLNRLEQVLARAQWDGQDAAEGLMRDEAGHVVEGTMSNLFIVREGAVITPDLTGCGIAGVMRRTLMDYLSRQGRPVAEQNVDQAVLGAADEVFVCNSVNGVWPVCEVAGSARWPVGPVTRELQHWIDEQGHACTPALRGAESE